MIPPHRGCAPGGAASPGGNRARGLVAFLLVAMVLVSLGPAAACVPRANLVSLQPRASGPAGSEVTVEALGFGKGKAEVRWNGASGPLLGTGAGPSFSASVTVPATAPGLYAVVVLIRQPGGSIGDAGAAAFQVTGAEGSLGQDPGGWNRDARGPAAVPSRPAGAPLLLAAGAGLLTLGVAVGVLLGRRRRPT